MEKELILLGKFSQDELNSLMSESYQLKDISQRIDFLSGHFLGLDYKESTLIGSKDTPEVLVINLEGVDCFTFIDYIEAMRLSGSFAEFRNNLVKVRYKSGIVAFKNRNHFFTDWVDFNSAFVEDVTEKVGYHRTLTVQKVLNKKEDGSLFLPGIDPVPRTIRFLPSDAVDASVLKNLSTGDYAGIYSHAEVLDVSHVGIIIRKEDDIYLRHASSQDKNRKVVDQLFIEYITDKPGIIVLRPRSVALQV